MLIIGCDYHPSFQRIALVDMETGEVQERRLKHGKRPSSFIALGQKPETKCAWGWKPVGMPDGSSVCQQS